MVWNTLNEPEGVTNVASQRVPKAAALCLVKAATRPTAGPILASSQVWSTGGNDASHALGGTPSPFRCKERSVCGEKCVSDRKRTLEGMLSLDMN